MTVVYQEEENQSNRPRGPLEVFEVVGVGQGNAVRCGGAGRVEDEIGDESSADVKNAAAMKYRAAIV